MKDESGPYTVDATYQSPAVILNTGKGIFEIKGSSTLENAQLFYGPICKLLERASIIPSTGSLQTVIDLEKFNSATVKSLLGVLKRLEKLKDKGRTVSVSWYYSEADALEIGEDLAYFVDIDFQFEER